MRQPERAVRENGRRRRLEAQRVDEETLVREAQSRRGGKDAEAVDVRPRHVEGGAPLEIGQRVPVQRDVVMSRDRRRPYAALETRRIEQLVYGKPGQLSASPYTVARRIDVDPAVEAQGARGTLQARCQLEVLDRAARLERPAQHSRDRQLGVRPSKHA